MWQRLATSELLSTFFPTWYIGKKHDSYWLNTHAHPVHSYYYPVQAIVRRLSGLFTSSLNSLYQWMWYSLVVHILWTFIMWYFLLRNSYGAQVALFGAITISFGSVGLRQQPCIIYTLAWFPLTLYHSPIISSIAVGMILLAGYYPFALYLLPVSLLANILWYKNAWLILGVLIGLPQLITFLAYLPKTVKRLSDSCQSPEVERRFYLGVIPILLLPFSTSRIWPITILSSLFAIGLCKNVFPRVHERWLIVVQFCLGWQATNGLSHLGLSARELWVVLGVHAFDLYWHNRECLPPRPYCELYQKPSLAFNTSLTRFLDTHLGDYRVAGLPHPLFTGLVNGFRTMCYQGSMQLRLMARWRGNSGSHGINGLSLEDLTRYRVKYAFERVKPEAWLPTPIKYLWQNPNIR